MLFAHLKTTSFFLQPKGSRSTKIPYLWKHANLRKQKRKKIIKDNKHKGMTPWKSTFGLSGLLKSQQNKQGVEGNTHTNVCQSI